MSLAARLEFGENFADVFALPGKCLRTLGVFRNVAEQVSVFLDVRAASGRIRDDSVHVSLLEHVNCFLGELNCIGFFSRMYEQSATTSLRVWSDDFTTFVGVSADCCGIHLREKLPLHAAKEQPDAAALWVDGRSDFRNDFLGTEFRKQRLHSLPFARKQLEQPQATHEGLQSGLLIREERRAQSVEAVRLGKRLKQEMAMALLGRRAAEIAFDLRACGFDKL